MSSKEEKSDNPVQPNLGHGFNWDLVLEPSTSPSEGVIESLFAKVCDALQFKNNEKIGESAIDKDGYYREAFYMIRPFYYIGEGFGRDSCVKNGIAFVTIAADADLDRLPIRKYLPKTDVDAIAQMPIVVFRNHRGPICIPGTTEDQSVVYHCQNDTFEFIGVFKAEKTSEDGCLKLTKVFDRYYFDTDNIITK